MANRKRPIILRCPVTAEERSLIEQKMAQFQTKRIGAYLRKMAIDGYQYFVFQDFFSLYLIAAGFPDMGYPYPGFPYLDKPYLARPHTAGPYPGDGASRR